MSGVRIYLAVALIIVVISVSSAEDYVLPKGVTVLSEEELLEKVVGNTISNDNVTEYYEPPISGEKNGKIRAKYSRGKFGGNWKIRGVLMCFNYDVEYLERFNDICYSIGVTGSRLDLYNVDGSKFYPGGGPYKLTSGNSAKL